eukprot:2565746-Rhodomonas_salina.1
MRSITVPHSNGLVATTPPGTDFAVWSTTRGTDGSVWYGTRPVVAESDVQFAHAVYVRAFPRRVSYPPTWAVRLRERMV